MINVRINNTYDNYKVCFGHNKGVLEAVESLKKRVTSENVQELQAQLQDVVFTPDFIEEICKLPDHWKKVLIKYASPKEIQDGLKRIFGMK